MSPKSWHFLPRRSPALSPVRISSSTGCNGTGEKPVHAIGWQQGEAQCTLALNFALNLPDGRQCFKVAVKPVAAAHAKLGRSIAFFLPPWGPPNEPIIQRPGAAAAGRQRRRAPAPVRSGRRGSIAPVGPLKGIE